MSYSLTVFKEVVVYFFESHITTYECQLIRCRNVKGVYFIWNVDFQKAQEPNISSIQLLFNLLLIDKSVHYSFFIDLWPINTGIFTKLCHYVPLYKKKVPYDWIAPNSFFYFQYCSYADWLGIYVGLCTGKQRRKRSSSPYLDVEQNLKC